MTPTDTIFRREQPQSIQRRCILFIQVVFHRIFIITASLLCSYTRKNRIITLRSGLTSLHVRVSYREFL